MTTGDRYSIEAAAAEWVVRLGGRPLAPEERAALEAWLAESADHRAAFDFASATWDQFDVGGVRAERSRPRRRWRQPAALAAMVMLAVTAGAVWFDDAVIWLSADHRTPAGQRMTVTLEDGSVIDMNTSTAIAVRFGSEQRRVDVLAGEAFFTAAPIAGGERRPFVVQARGGSARALGTRFMVDLFGEGVDVTVVEHDVAVSAADGQQAVLSAGQAVRYDGNGLGQARPANLAHATAWRRGRLIFDRVPLAEVAEQLGHYMNRRIVIADKALAARRFSGVFDTGDPAAALAAVTREVGGRQASVPPFVTILY